MQPRIGCRFQFPFAVLALALFTTGAQAQPPRKVDFAHDIVPLLKARCAECHTAGKYKGSFSLDTRGDVLKKKAVVPGKSGESELIRRVTGRPLSHRPLLTYLRRKYEPLYGI